MSLKKVLKTTLLVTALVSGLSVSAEENIPDPFAQMKANADSAAPSAVPANGVAPAPIVIPEPPVFDAQSWVLMDYSSGRVICEHNSHEKIWPASLTKMMTAYVIGMELKAGRLHMEDDVTITEDAWAKKYTDSSKMFIEVGKTIKVGDLVKGIIIQSGNDACVAMAIHLAGTQEGFVSVMNNYAAQLGLKDTHFSNVHGLFDELNYSSAYDMALLGRATIRDLPDEYPLYSQKEFTFNGIKQMNRNRLLWDKAINVDGIKTGHLSQVGYNLVTSATNDGMRLVASVIGAKSEKLRADYNKALLTYGFRYFQQYTPVTANKVLLTRNVRMGKTNQVRLAIQKDLNLMIPRGRQGDIKLGYRLKKSVFTAPINKGDELGVIEVKIDDNVISTVPLVSVDVVEECGFFGRLWDKICLFFSSDEEVVEEA
ncbi:penicillin-binding protein 6. Serine peptidase. MEROPS family S11 [Succinivibrio dextrinosolvens DSM 3072]|jgi:D-alanyl-D-alanine carboxypeptidase (penicillin-binding protein 5/6)|uniref:serine-type D-Ala-D-Ala carboxypeptidase n=2 Tax=Succinivibrio dextrinosolvens TaxID=83771 RepID=A0A1T4V099_9GAMM|nr:serine hydrolase [Succinivibrio dextrinosolvens]SKA58389.1 penicillin-binding protein 6. Serine peptidase. MEROPS family S11 [Succinivibrio dextrinosolvens DSM 3072]